INSGNLRRKGPPHQHSHGTIWPSGLRRPCFPRRYGQSVSGFPAGNLSATREPTSFPARRMCCFLRIRVYSLFRDDPLFVAQSKTIVRLFQVYFEESLEIDGSRYYSSIKTLTLTF